MPLKPSRKLEGFFVCHSDEEKNLEKLIKAMFESGL
jgi:hypothetical protein